MRTSLRPLLTAALAAVALAAPASAVLAEGSGHGTLEPFRVEVSRNLPASSATLALENGIATLSVLPGHEVVAYGVEDEEFLRVEKDGTVIGTTSSMTYQMAEITPQEGSKPSGGGTDQVVVATNGAVTYHEHRVHFMSQSVDPSIAAGGVVSTFSLSFDVDGERSTVEGTLVFDPSMNPERARELVSTGAPDAISTACSPDAKDCQENGRSMHSCDGSGMKHDGMDHSGMKHDGMDHSEKMTEECNDVALKGGQIGHGHGADTRSISGSALAAILASLGFLACLLTFMLGVRRGKQKTQTEKPLERIASTNESSQPPAVASDDATTAPHGDEARDAVDTAHTATPLESGTDSAVEPAADENPTA